MFFRSNTRRWPNFSQCHMQTQSPRKTSAIGAFLEAIHHIRQNCFRHNFICKVLLDNVLFIKTTKILTFYAHISTNTRLFFVWSEELFCWRMSTSIYIVSDQKLTMGARGFGVADNVTANALVKAQGIQLASKWQVFFNISQILECLALHFVKQVAESQPDKSLAKSA